VRSRNKSTLPEFAASAGFELAFAPLRALTGQQLGAVPLHTAFGRGPALHYPAWLRLGNTIFFGGGLPADFFQALLQPLRVGRSLRVGITHWRMNGNPGPGLLRGMCRFASPESILL